jgi:hypothetical protein
VYLTRLGVVGTEGVLADAQGRFEFGAGTGEVPQVPKQEAEVVAVNADVGVVGTVSGSRTRLRALTSKFRPRVRTR